MHGDANLAKLFREIGERWEIKRSVRWGGGG